MPDFLSLFEHVEEMHPILYPLLSQPLYGEVIDSFHRQMASSWLDQLQPRCESPDEADFAAELLAAGFLATAKKWVVTGCDRPAREISADYERYATALIREALETPSRH